LNANTSLYLYVHVTHNLEEFILINIISIDQVFFKFIQLFANRNKDVLCKLAMYCPKAYDVRTSTLDNIM